MEVKVKLTGMEELQTAIDTAQAKLYELRKAASEIQTAINNIGMEVNQPSQPTNNF